MSDGAPPADELRTTRLSLRRPAEADVGSIFAIHHDPETCLHNPSDTLATFEEAESLYRPWDAGRSRTRASGALTCEVSAMTMPYASLLTVSL
jgi:hypothetical protein